MNTTTTDPHMNTTSTEPYPNSTETSTLHTSTIPWTTTTTTALPTTTTMTTSTTTCTTTWSPKQPAFHDLGMMIGMCLSIFFLIGIANIVLFKVTKSKMRRSARMSLFGSFFLVTIFATVGLGMGVAFTAEDTAHFVIGTSVMLVQIFVLLNLFFFGSIVEETAGPAADVGIMTAIRVAVESMTGRTRTREAAGADARENNVFSVSVEDGPEHTLDVPPSYEEVVAKQE